MIVILQKHFHLHVSTVRVIAKFQTRNLNLNKLNTLKVGQSFDLILIAELSGFKNNL